MIGRTNEFLLRRSTPSLVILTIFLAGILGIFDYLTGYDVSFAVFYLVPVSIASWYAGIRLGFFMSSLTATLWLISNALTEPGRELSTLNLVWNAGTRLGFFVVTSTLLARLRQALAREADLARKDGLTHLLNTRAFHEVGAMEIERARRNRQPLSLIFLDLDDFKQVNDRYGHHQGDRLLIKVAQTLQANLRMTDLIARLGGDEFAILLPGAGKEAAEATAQKILDKMARAAEAAMPVISCSLGVVTYETPPAELQAVLQEADQVMYSVKGQGKKGIQHKVIVESASPTDVFLSPMPDQ